MKSELMKYDCLHPSLDDEDSECGNCKECGVFLTQKGIFAYREFGEHFWAEVGCHRHYISMLQEEARCQNATSHFSEGDAKEMNMVLGKYIPEFGQKMRL